MIVTIATAPSRSSRRLSKSWLRLPTAAVGISRARWPRRARYQPAIAAERRPEQHVATRPKRTLMIARQPGQRSRNTVAGTEGVATETATAPVATTCAAIETPDHSWTVVTQCSATRWRIVIQRALPRSDEDQPRQPRRRMLAKAARRTALLLRLVAHRCRTNRDERAKTIRRARRHLSSNASCATTSRPGRQHADRPR